MERTKEEGCKVALGGSLKSVIRPEVAIGDFDPSLNPAETEPAHGSEPANPLPVTEETATD